MHNRFSVVDRGGRAAGIPRLSNYFCETLCIRSISFAVLVVLVGAELGHGRYRGRPDLRGRMLGRGENEIKRMHKVSQKLVEGRGNAMEPTPGSCADGGFRARAGLSRVFSHLG